MSSALDALDDLPIEPMVNGVAYLGAAAVAGVIKLGKIANNVFHGRGKFIFTSPYKNLPINFKKYLPPVADTYLALLPINAQNIITAYTSHNIAYPLPFVSLVTSGDYLDNKKKKFQYQYDSLYEHKDSLQQIGISSFYDKQNVLNYGIVIKVGNYEGLLKLHYFLFLKGINCFIKSPRKKDQSIGFVCKEGETHPLCRCLNILRRHNDFFLGYNPIFSLIHKMTPYPFERSIFNDPKGTLTFVKKDLDNGFINRIVFSQHLDKNVIWQVVITFNETRHAFEAYNHYLHALQIFGLIKVEEEGDSSEQRAFYQLRGTTYKEVTEFQDFMYQLSHNNLNKYHQDCFENIGNNINITEK